MHLATIPCGSGTWRHNTVNACGRFYETALQAACTRGHTVVVELLLQHGASVHIKEGDQGTALNAASRGGYIAIVKLLLDHGADYPMRAPLGDSELKLLWCPLHL